MLITRYLAKEVLTTLTVIITVLLVVFLSNRLLLLLEMATLGQFPVAVVMKLVLLNAPALIGMLMPIALFFAILLSYGRLYIDNEMTVLSACGFSQGQLLKSTFYIACFVAVIVGFCVLYIGPRFMADYARLSRESGTAVLVDAILPGQFHQADHGKTVIYTQKKTDAGMQDIFLAQQKSRPGDGRYWQIMTAKSGETRPDEPRNGSYFLAKNGQLVKMIPGQGQVDIASFDQLGVRLSKDAPVVIKKAKALPTSQLWPLNNKNLKYAAELQWRLSFPILTILFALMAVPIAKINPRQGRFAKFIPGALLAITYANLLISARKWVGMGKIPVSIGLWWLHIAAIFLLILMLSYPRIKLYWQRH